MEPWMNHLPIKSALSINRRRLVETMQTLNFGRIEALHIRAGEPAFSPAPRVTQDIKLGTENSPRPELDRVDFVLRSSVIEMFAHFEKLHDGTVAVIEVRHGLPFRLVLERSCPEAAR
jgi:hypothetical protein